MQCDAGILTIVSTLMRIIASLCILLCGVNCCEQNYRETDRIICVIDDLLINKKIGKFKSSYHQTICRKAFIADCVSIIRVLVTKDIIGLNKTKLLCLTHTGSDIDRRIR